MSRFSPVDLSAYPVQDILEQLAFEVYLARDRADLQARWTARRATRPELPAFDTILLESDPSSVVLEVGSYRELVLRARINDQVRQLTLAGALGPALDHIGVTYYRTPRLPGEMDEVYRQRLAIAPESWSTAGPVGAYVFWALSASADVRDVAVYSEDEGVTLSPRIRVVLLPKPDLSPARIDAMVAAVRERLSRRDIRPAGDLVTVELAAPLPFDLTVSLRLRSGVSAQVVADAARQRLQRFAAGLLRYAGEGETGPVWLIGRTFPVETLAGAAMGGDPNIVDCDIIGGDINAAHPAYTEQALAGVGSAAFQPLPEAHTAHLFRAPMIGSVTVTTSVITTGWSG